MTLHMVGTADLSGQQFGTCLITSMAARRPAPRWNVTCVRCHSRWQEDHVRLVNAGTAYKCRNVACAKAREDEIRNPVQSVTTTTGANITNA
jgi:hypothetical protein